MNIRGLGWVCLTWGSCLLVAAGWAGAAPRRADPHPPPGGQAARALAQPTPMRDRLAAPPTVENPTQADLGAQVYWLNCQPCHGDVGQGLTDDWRAQYPPEDQNCWESNCHGDRPYDSGFTLPRFVPAVIGPQALTRFTTAADLYQFTHAAMPFNAPGSLSEAEYWQLTAYLLWANGQPAAAELSSLEAAALIGLHGPLPAPTPAPAAAPTTSPIWIAVAGAGAGIVIILGVWAWRRLRLT